MNDISSILKKKLSLNLFNAIDNTDAWRTTITNLDMSQIVSNVAFFEDECNVILRLKRLMYVTPNRLKNARSNLDL